MMWMENCYEILLMALCNFSFDNVVVGSGKEGRILNMRDSEGMKSMDDYGMLLRIAFREPHKLTV